MKSFIALAMVLSAASAAMLIDEASGPCILKDKLSSTMKLMSAIGADDKVRDGHIT